MGNNMKEIQKLLLAALVKISAGENDEAHELVDQALGIIADMGDDE